MEFPTESTGYEKTILSDLQGAWCLLRDTVARCDGFKDIQRALFHIDEAMSWETVRNLHRMKPLLLIIRNICTSGDAPQEVLESIEEVTLIYQDLQYQISKGDPI
jgi:hypothetical protein